MPPDEHRAALLKILRAGGSIVISREGLQALYEQIEELEFLNEGLEAETEKLDKEKSQLERELDVALEELEALHAGLDALRRTN